MILLFIVITFYNLYDFSFLLAFALARFSPITDRFRDLESLVGNRSPQHEIRARDESRLLECLRVSTSPILLSIMMCLKTK